MLPVWFLALSHVQAQSTNLALPDSANDQSIQNLSGIQVSIGDPALPGTRRLSLHHRRGLLTNTSSIPKAHATLAKATFSNSSTAFNLTRSNAASAQGLTAVFGSDSGSTAAAPSLKPVSAATTPQSGQTTNIYTKLARYAELCAAASATYCAEAVNTKVVGNILSSDASTSLGYVSRDDNNKEVIVVCSCT